MGGRVSRSRACRSHLELFKFSQGKSLDAVASKSAGPPPSHREHSPVGGDLAQGTTASQCRKRREADAASVNDPLPAKRVRFTRTDARTEPRRRSARLQPRQHSAGSEGSGIIPPAPSCRPQIEVDTASRPLASKRTRLTRTNTPQPGVNHKELPEVAKPNPPKRPYTSVVEPTVDGPEQATPATRRRRKRQIGRHSDDDDDDDDDGGDGDEHQPKRARLTRENLALFDKMAGKKEKKKKGTTTASMSAPPDSTGESSDTKTTSTTTSGFAIQAYKNGILDPLSSKPPSNLEHIRKRHAQARGTASPPESKYEDYVDRVGGAPNEATMVVEVSGRLLKEYEGRGYKKAFNQAFTGFPKDTGFNNSLSVPQPDFVEGPEMRDYRPFPVDERISGAVLYKDNPRSVTLSHLAGEWKGPGKDMAKAKLQSAYDGAALVYARNQALSYLGNRDPPPGHAEVTTFTTDGTNLNIYAHYAALLEDGTVVEYHQYPVSSTNLTNSYQEHKDGRRALRNEQDHARKQSFALRDRLKEHWKQRRDAPQPVAEGVRLPVADATFGETNEDEAGYEVVELPCQPTPAASSQPCTASSSVSSSKPLSPANDCAPGSNGGRKRKASLPSTSSRKSPRP